MCVSEVCVSGYETPRPTHVFGFRFSRISTSVFPFWPRSVIHECVSVFPVWAVEIGEQWLPPLADKLKPNCYGPKTVNRGGVGRFRRYRRDDKINVRRLVHGKLVSEFSNTIAVCRTYYFAWKEEKRTENTPFLDRPLSNAFEQNTSKHFSRVFITVLG